MNDKYVQELEIKNERYIKGLNMIVKNEVLGRCVETGKTIVSNNGAIALMSLGEMTDKYIVLEDMEDIISVE